MVFLLSSGIAQVGVNHFLILHFLNFFSIGFKFSRQSYLNSFIFLLSNNFSPFSEKRDQIFTTYLNLTSKTELCWGLGFHVSFVSQV